MLLNTRYIFFGSPEFSAIILNKLMMSGFIPEAVVCGLDRPVGRKKIITPPPVKSLVLKHKAWNIHILQPENLDKNFMFHVSSFTPDVFIVASYSKIIPEEILKIPKLGAIGVHPSLLPKYRGPSPIQGAILNNEKETGATIYLMDEKIDNGPILSSEKIIINEKDDYESLYFKLADFSANLLVKVINNFLENKITPKPQDAQGATYTKKFITQDAYVDIKEIEIAENGSASSPQKALEIFNKIRALNPEPGVWTIKDGKRMKILESKLDENGLLKITKIQFESKTPVEI